MNEKSTICQDLVLETNKPNNSEKELKILDCLPEKKNLNSKHSKPESFYLNKDFLTLDAFGFGMSFNCLQVTFSSRNITEARYVYDSLSVLSPLFLAQSASTSVIDSTLIDWDTRCRFIEQSTDSRNLSEYVTNYISLQSYNLQKYRQHIETLIGTIFHE